MQHWKNKKKIEYHPEEKIPPILIQDMWYSQVLKAPLNMDRVGAIYA